jgi:hypothetical protein
MKRKPSSIFIPSITSDPLQIAQHLHDLNCKTLIELCRKNSLPIHKLKHRMVETLASHLAIEGGVLHLQVLIPPVSARP